MDLSPFSRSKIVHDISIAHHQMLLLSLSIDPNLSSDNEKMSGNSIKVVMVVGKRFNNLFSSYLLRLLLYQQAPKLISNLISNLIRKLISNLNRKLISNLIRKLISNLIRKLIRNLIRKLSRKLISNLNLTLNLL